MALQAMIIRGLLRKAVFSIGGSKPKGPNINLDYKVEIRGLDEFHDSLAQLEMAVRNKILKQAGRTAMAPVLERVKMNIPVDTGGLKATARMSASTDLRRMRKLKNATMVASVSVGRASRKDGVTGYQALQIEYGNARTKAQPFMRPAISGKEKEVLNTFARELGKGIEKEAIKAEKLNHVPKRNPKA